MGTQTNDVYEGLKKAINENRYKPAESLTELELAGQYKVSRNTVKKALLMLEKENLVTIERNKSAKVRAFSQKEILEYFEVRETLEGLVIRLAVPVITEEQTHRMEELIAQMERLIAANELLHYTRCNYEFHAVIYDACPNKKAAAMALALKSQMDKHNLKIVLVPGRNLSSIDEHRAILHAVRDGDVELSEILMRRHIANVRSAFQNNYQILL